MTKSNPPTKTAMVSRPDIFPRMGDWVLHTAVAALVWEAIKRVQPHDLRPVAPATAGLAYRPVNLLALLTYSYAVGVYGSQDIEQTMREDAHFRALCRNEFPHWKMLRRFRRYNGEAVRHCLAETFRLAWSLTSPPASARDYAKMGLNNEKNHGIEQGVPVEGRRSEQEAADRVERAVWIDQMAMDDEF